MEKKAEYRSAVRSRENIRKAYVELIHEKNTIKVTVKELVERADVNRSTFYAHYQDIYAVLEEIENEVVEKLFAFLDATEHTELLYNPLPFLMRVGLELEQNRDFYRLLIATGGSGGFIQKLKGMFLRRMVMDRKAYSKIRRQREFMICMSFLADGGVGLLCEWVTGEIDIPMQELTSILNDIAMNVMRQYV